MKSFTVSTIDGLPVDRNKIINPEEVTEVYAFGQDNQLIPAWNREFTPLKGTYDEK